LNLGASRTGRLAGFSPFRSWESQGHRQSNNLVAPACETRVRTYDDGYSVVFNTQPREAMTLE